MNMNNSVWIPVKITEKLFEIIEDIYSDDSDFIEYLVNEFKTHLNSFTLCKIDENLNVILITNRFIFESYEQAKNNAINQNLTNE